MNSNSDTDRIFLTPGGRERLRQRIEAARSRYLETCGQNEDAAGAGDSSVWHDNFAYEENQRKMHMIARQVHDLESLWARAETVPLPTTDPDRVRIGVWVAYLIEETGKEETLWIAGYDDGDSDVRRVAYNSPLAKALIGAEPGDRRTVHLGHHDIRVEVSGIWIASESDDA